MNAAVIATEGLRKEYGPKTAVADLTLSVGRGEVFGFLGPNGAGKTTSVKMLLGLVAPTAGGARVLGAPLGDVAARARMGFLPEHFRFQDWLSAREFLRFHGRLYRLEPARLDARIERLLAQVDLLDAGERRLRDFSKGMLQRVGLAQALLSEPELVFLDEPTSGLDPLGRLLVRDVIAGLRAAGTTVFLNSHLLGEVEVTCDRVAFVKQGRVVRELALRGAAAATEGLEVELRLGALTPELLSGLAQFGQDVRALNGAHSGDVRLLAAGEERLPEIARWLVGQGVPIYRLAAERKSLEQLFLEVMGEGERPG
jgi:ABC-2 type transport system ATP-binding protein